MPFINGRYHMNPTMGEALEAAREAEATLLAQQQAARDSRENVNAAPIHRIEIDAEVGPPGRRLGEPGESIVPHATGRATRSFVARVHRTVATRPPASFTTGAGHADDSCYAEPASSAAAPETHVFADHRDLLDFLRDTLAS